MQSKGIIVKLCFLELTFLFYLLINIHISVIVNKIFLLYDYENKMTCMIKISNELLWNNEKMNIFFFI